VPFTLVRDFSAADVDEVVGLDRGFGDALAVDVRAVRAALVLEQELARQGDEVGVLLADRLAVDDDVEAGLAPDDVDTGLEVEGAELALEAHEARALARDGHVHRLG